MIQKIKNSIVVKIGALLTSVVVLALFSMISSYLISDFAEKDAEAVNVSGSLRMHSYKLTSIAMNANHSAQDENVLKESLAEFEQLLKHPVLAMELKGNASLNSQYEAVIKFFRESFQPALLEYTENSFSEKTLLEKTENFVSLIHQLVGLYQKAAEDKVANIRLIQVFSLFLTLIFVFIALSTIKRSIEMPLNKLTEAARKITSGDFLVKVELNNQDELGLLSETINQMTSTLSGMYAKLESKVEEKTLALQKSNQALEFLFLVSKEISTNSYSDKEYEEWLRKLKSITNLKTVDICFTRPTVNSPYLHLMADSECLNPECAPINCESCLNNGKKIDASSFNIPILERDARYGVLTGLVNQGHLDDWQVEILQSFADLIAISQSLKNQMEQERKLSLITERTTIARELHDSIAQALSYQRIQVTRLKRIIAQGGNNKEKTEEVIDELQQGVKSAYQQLRELLTTFRLKLSGEDLSSSLIEMATQLKEQSEGFEINLDFQANHIPFAPNEEIHILQLAREAVQNAIKHSNGSIINISCIELSDQRIQIQISDNGIGIPIEREKLNHYGMAIMAERARNLGGDLSIDNTNPGTLVSIVFQPMYLD